MFAKLVEFGAVGGVKFYLFYQDKKMRHFIGKNWRVAVIPTMFASLLLSVDIQTLRRALH